MPTPHCPAPSLKPARLHVTAHTLDPHRPHHRPRQDVNSDAQLTLALPEEGGLGPIDGF